jgi:hypothetical protein
MDGLVNSYPARLSNSMHDEPRAAGSGDPSISPMYWKTGEFTTDSASPTDFAVLRANCDRMSALVVDETKSHLEHYDQSDSLLLKRSCYETHRIYDEYISNVAVESSLFPFSLMNSNA